MIYAGLDIGKERDYSALAIGSVDRQRINIIDVIQFRLGRYPRQEVRDCYKQYRWARLGVDYTTEKSFSDELKMEGMRIEEMVFTNNSKNDMIHFLWNLVKEKRITVPARFTELKSQMLEQLRVVTSSHIRYEHPSGRHDDQFWALAICCYTARQLLITDAPHSLSPRDIEAMQRASLPQSSIRVVDG